MTRKELQEMVNSSVMAETSALILGSLSELYTKVENMSREMTELVSRVKTLSLVQDEMSESVVAAIDDIKTHSEELTALKDTIESWDETVSQVTKLDTEAIVDRLDELEKSNGDLEEQVDNIQSTVDDVQSTIDDYDFDSFVTWSARLDDFQYLERDINENMGTDSDELERTIKSVIRDNLTLDFHI